MKPPSDITISNSSTSVSFRVSDTGSVHFSAFSEGSGAVTDTRQPLAELRYNGIGCGVEQQKTGKGLVGGSLSLGLKYDSHTIRKDSGNVKLEIIQTNSDVTVTSHIILVGELPVLRSFTTLRNTTSAPIHLYQLSSLVFPGIGDEHWFDYRLHVANNSWFREAQWQAFTLPSLGLDTFGLTLPHDITATESMAYHSVTNRSTFSTQGHLPMGILEKEGDVWMWQIETNGAWRWDVGDSEDRLYIATTGPEANDHEWRLKVKPGDAYTTPVTALYHGKDISNGFEAITRYRRIIIHPHPDYHTMPIIFNDYMNCLLGDPTDQKILALLEPVAQSGAEYFVIDAGWYADDKDWWNDVGEWLPSEKRFPMGFMQLLEVIRDKGLKPGLWIEPEVIGVRCPLAESLPFEAFLQRDGHRIVERGRYHLDFRHSAVTARLDEVVRRLHLDYGSQYFKFDYNIEHVLGTDVGCSSAGVGQADHGRAYLDWVRSLLKRYPTLVIENCSSGGMRMEYGMMSVHTLQSTSDQQDPVLYAAIAAAVPTAILPEQGAVWAYPQPSWSDEINALTVANSLLSRVHLSGRLDLLSRHQLDDIVYEGMRVYQDIRLDLRLAVPFWPIGLPKWSDKWLALGMRVSNDLSYLMVWRRGGENGRQFPNTACENSKITLLYPKGFQVDTRWDQESRSLVVSMDSTVCARLVRIESG